MNTKLAVVLTSIGFAAITHAGEFKVDDEGFIRNWLVLAPIEYDSNNTGDTEIVKEQVKDEAKLTPKAGEKSKADDKTLEWKTGKASDYYFDFNTWLGKGENEKAEHVIGYLCATVIAPEAMTDVEVKLSSNDQCRLYLNGKNIFTFDGTRSIEQDQDSIKGVSLQKGDNTIVFKILNEENNWAGALRFADAKGNPINTLKVMIAE